MYNISNEEWPHDVYGQCMWQIGNMLIKNILRSQKCIYFDTWGCPGDVLDKIIIELNNLGYTVTSNTNSIEISWSEPLDVIAQNDQPVDDMVCYDYLLDVGPEVKDNKENDSNESDNVFGQLGDMLRPH